MATWNVRGLGKAEEKERNFLLILRHIRIKSIHVLCLQEFRPDPVLLARFKRAASDQGYLLLVNAPPPSDAGSGLGILVALQLGLLGHQRLMPGRLSLISVRLPSAASLQLLAVYNKTWNGQKDAVLKEQFEVQMSEIISAYNGELIMAGDWNGVLEPSQRASGRVDPNDTHLQAMLGRAKDLGFDFVPSCRSPEPLMTLWSAQDEPISRLDHIFLPRSMALFLAESETSRPAPFCTDHSMVSAFMRLEIERLKDPAPVLRSKRFIPPASDAAAAALSLELEGSHLTLPETLTSILVSTIWPRLHFERSWSTVVVLGAALRSESS